MVSNGIKSTRIPILLKYCPDKYVYNCFYVENSIYQVEEFTLDIAQVKEEIIRNKIKGKDYIKMEIDYIF